MHPNLLITLKKSMLKAENKIGHSQVQFLVSLDLMETLKVSIIFTKQNSKTTKNSQCINLFQRLSKLWKNCRNKWILSKILCQRNTSFRIIKSKLHKILSSTKNTESQVTNTTSLQNQNQLILQTSKL